MERGGRVLDMLIVSATGDVIGVLKPYLCKDGTVNRQSKIYHDEPLPGTTIAQGGATNPPLCSAEARLVTLMSMANSRISQII